MSYGAAQSKNRSITARRCRALSRRESADGNNMERCLASAVCSFSGASALHGGCDTSSVPHAQHCLDRAIVASLWSSYCCSDHNIAVEGRCGVYKLRGDRLRSEKKPI